MSRPGRAPRPTAEHPSRPSLKAPRGGPSPYIFTSGLERQLGLWLELNPSVVQYRRADGAPRRDDAP
jgi:hypothetical protein